MDADRYDDKVRRWLANVLSPEEDVTPAGFGSLLSDFEPHQDAIPFGLSSPRPGGHAYASSALPNEAENRDHGDGTWVLRELEKQCNGFLLNDILAPPLALCSVERVGVESRREAMAVAMMQTSLSVVLKTSTPIAAAFTKTKFQIFVGVLGMFMAFITYTFIMPNHKGQAGWTIPVLRTRAVRFVPHELRNGARAPNIHSPGIDTFGLATDGVPSLWQLKNGTAAVVGSEMHLTFPSEVTFNGWWMLTSQSAPPEEDAVSFELLAQLICDGGCPPGAAEEPSEEWVRVGGSGWFQSGMGDDSGTGITPARVPEERGQMMEFDHSKNMGKVVVNTMIGLVWIGPTIGPTLWLSVCFAAVKNVPAAMRMFGLSWVLVGIWFVARGVIFGFHSGWLAGFVRASPGIIVCFLGLFLEKFQSRIFFVAVGLSMPIAAAICISVFHLEDSLVRALFLGGLMTAFPLLVNVKMWHMLREARNLVTKDKEMYDLVWEQVLAQDAALARGDGQPRGLQLIELLSEAVRGGCDPSICRQLHRSRRDIGALAPTTYKALRSSFFRQASKPVAPSIPVTQTPTAPQIRPRPIPEEMLQDDTVSRPTTRTEGNLGSAVHGPVVGGPETLGPSSRVPIGEQAEPPNVQIRPRPSTAQLGDEDAMSNLFSAHNAPSVLSIGDSPSQAPERSAAERSFESHDISFAISGFNRDQLRRGEPDARAAVAPANGLQEAVVLQGERGTKTPLGPRNEIFMGPKYFRFASFKGSVDASRPVKSLDQIYLQASVLSPFLRAYLMVVAAKSNALLKFKRPADPGGVASSDMPRWKTTFESWREVGVVPEGSGKGSEKLSSKSSSGRISSAGPVGARSEAPTRGQNAGGVLWAPLKSLQRATEKALRNYSGDLSKLLDVCRETLVFETPDDLAACLAAILEEPDFVVVRVKNRLCPSFDAVPTAGYRNVLVNLRIVSDTTTYFGIDTHVCELQLVLLSFAQIKDNDAHSRYRRFRDYRGE